MGFVKKTWKNRISEFFNRYRVENAKTGDISEVYLNLNDGAVEQTGDVIDANTLNDLETRIANAFDEGGTSEVYIAGVEASSTASQAYTVGQFLIYNSILYKVKSAIAQGDTLTVGTNIGATKVADELSNHLCVSGNEFYFDYHDGKYGYNTNANRGADTFNPFSGATVHTETYTYPANSTGGTYDMGEEHDIRYVNASNVYAKGKADGDVKHSVNFRVNHYTATPGQDICIFYIYKDGKLVSNPSVNTASIENTVYNITTITV